jgi:hypothetical protein
MATTSLRASAALYFLTLNVLPADAASAPRLKQQREMAQ